MARWLPLLCLLCMSPALLAGTPTRIVSLTPHLTELLFAIGAGDRIVATDDASDYPPEVKRLPQVANYRSINLEALLAQKPDLIVAWRSAQARMLGPVEQLGIPVFYSEPTDFASLATEMRALGKTLGVEQTANAEADAYLARLAALGQRYGKPKHIKVFYQLWYPPLTSVSGNAWSAQAIELCGGENVMAAARTHALPSGQPGTGNQGQSGADPGGESRSRRSAPLATVAQSGRSPPSAPASHQLGRTAPFHPKSPQRRGADMPCH